MWDFDHCQNGINWFSTALKKHTCLQPDQPSRRNLSAQWEGRSLSTQTATSSSDFECRHSQTPRLLEGRRTEPTLRAMPGPASTPQQSRPLGGLAMDGVVSEGPSWPHWPARGPGPACGPAGAWASPRLWLCAALLAPLPGQGSAACALGVPRLFGTGSKLMQNTVQALSCELLRRGHGRCKEYAQPWVCLWGERKGCCGKWPRHCSSGVLYLVYRTVPSGEHKHARDDVSWEL